MKQNKAILKLVKKYGSITELANQIGVSRTYVGHWLHGRRPIPVDLVKKLALLSEGELKRKDFRPDIFDDENI